MKGETHFENDYYAQNDSIFSYTDDEGNKTSSGPLRFGLLAHLNFFHGPCCAICMRFKSTDDDRKTAI